MFLVFSSDKTPILGTLASHEHETYEKIVTASCNLSERHFKRWDERFLSESLKSHGGDAVIDFVDDIEFFPSKFGSNFLYLAFIEWITRKLTEDRWEVMKHINETEFFSF